MNIAKQIYADRLENYKHRLLKAKKICNFIGNSRLVLALLTGIVTYNYLEKEMFINATIIFIVGAVLFLGLIICHEIFEKKKSLYEKIKLLNEKGLKRINNEWSAFRNRGEEFIDDNHEYATDLDIFGNNSLYQWICSAYTYFGKLELAELLRGKSREIEDVKKRQDAINELARKIEWRQKFESEAVDLKNDNDRLPIIAWLSDGKYPFISNPFYKLICYVPYISLIISLAAILIYKSWAPAVIVYSIQLFLFVLLNAKTQNVISLFGESGERLLIYSNIIRFVEECMFRSPMLKEKLINLKNNKKQTASQSLKQLSSIIHSSDIRFNALVHLLANIVWLWDIKCVIKMENWKKKNGGLIEKWLRTIGEFESLASLSHIRFENESWPFPDIANSSPLISARSIGHPLIPHEARVTNDFLMNNNGSAIIITGSNMSGKSTYLRTVGMNYILAFAGAPVCAEEMSCSVIKLYTSMRVKDNIAEHISTFYAELIRIKKIIDTAKQFPNTFFLIDELFSGTNSIDRHVGAKAVLNALVRSNASGMISTHDLELCSLEEENTTHYINYHFEEYYENDVIKFDYKIKKGGSKTRNAQFLIKMIGIPIARELSADLPKLPENTKK